MDPDDGTARLVKVVVELVHETVCRGILRVSIVRRGTRSLGELRSSGEAEVKTRSCIGGHPEGHYLMSTFMSL